MLICQSARGEAACRSCTSVLVGVGVTFSSIFRARTEICFDILQSLPTEAALLT